MPTYGLYGFAVASDLTLPELPMLAAGAGIEIRRGRVDAPASGWFDIWPHSDGRSWVRGCRLPSGYQVRHGDCAAFDVQRRLIVYDAPGCDEALLRHFLVDQIVPLLLSLDGLVLHASSVEIAGGVVAFVGPGGAGKSTLALALARAGHSMVSDDGLLLRADGSRLTPLPAYAGVRLWDDSAAALAADEDASIAGATGHKRCYLESSAFTTRALALQRIYVVDPQPSAGLAFERLSGADAAIEIVRQTYRLALDDRLALERQLDDIVALTRAVPVWRLAFPRALDRVAALAASVAAGIAQHAEIQP